MAKKTKRAVAEAMECKPRRFAPRLTLSADDIKGLKDMKVGDTHELKLKGKLVALRKDEYGWDDQEDRPLEGTFKIELVDNKDITSHYDDDDDD